MKLHKVSNIINLFLIDNTIEGKLYLYFRKQVFHNNTYNASFLIKKNHKLMKIHRKRLKEKIINKYITAISHIALSLVKECNKINYIGLIDNYHAWETWHDEKVNQGTVYIFYDYKELFIIKDVKRVNEFNAYLFTKNAAT